MARLTDLLKLAAMAAMFSDPGSLRNPFYRGLPEPIKEKELAEYTWKGHKVMAYSKTDAKNRIKAMLHRQKNNQNE